MIPSARGHWFQTSPHVPEALTPLIVDHVKRGLIISAHLVVDLAAPSVQRGGAVDRTHYGYLQSSELIQARIQDPGRGPRRKVALSDQTENPQPASKRSVGGPLSIRARTLRSGFVAERRSVQDRSEHQVAVRASYRTAMGRSSGRLGLHQSLRVALPR